MMDQVQNSTSTQKHKTLCDIHANECNPYKNSHVLSFPLPPLSPKAKHSLSHCDPIAGNALTTISSVLLLSYHCLQEEIHSEWDEVFPTVAVTMSQWIVFCVFHSQHDNVGMRSVAVESLQARLISLPILPLKVFLHHQLWPILGLRSEPWL